MLIRENIILMTFALTFECHAFISTTRPALWKVQTFSRQPVSLFVADTLEGVPIKVTGNNVEVTESMQSYLNEKLDKTLKKFGESKVVNEISCNVHLSVNKNPSVKNGHTCEVVTTLAGGATIRVEETTADMYTSIDFVSDRLARKLRKYKERKLDGYHGNYHDP